MMLGQASGKVGSIVFSRTNGQQVIRTKAETVKNPKTLKQTIQRILLNTCAQAYSNGQAIFDHSFEGKKSGQESMNTFMKKNLEYLRKRIADLMASGYTYDDLFNFVPIGMSGLYAGAWILSNGQLPKVAVTLTPYTTFGSAKAKVALGANTYGDVISQYNLQRGDQLTFVTIENPMDSDQIYFNYTRVILDPRNADGTPADLTTPFIVDGAINLPNSRNEGNFGTLAYDGGNVRFSLTTGDVVCAAVIVSREVNGVWKRSFAQFVVNETLMTEFNAYSLAMAIENSKGVSIDLASELYLNNAGTGGVQSTNSGGSAPVNPDAVSIDPRVKFTGANGDVTTSVAGGSVQVAGPVTAIVVSGRNLTNASIKAGTNNSASAAEELETTVDGTKAMWDGSLAIGSTLYVFADGSLWFTVQAITAGGGGMEEG